MSNLSVSNSIYLRSTLKMEYKPKYLYLSVHIAWKESNKFSQAILFKVLQ